MSDEIFDVVNAQDEVVGTATRQEVHARGLMHRAVHVLVFNAQGEVFLQKRSMTKDNSPGLWDSSASGHVDAGEPYDACAMREVQEELGVVLPCPPQGLFKLAACRQTDQEHVWVYRVSSEGPFDLNPNEIEGGEWFAAEAVARTIEERPDDFSEAFKHVWKHWLSRARTHQLKGAPPI